MPEWTIVGEPVKRPGRDGRYFVAVLCSCGVPGNVRFYLDGRLRTQMCAACSSRANIIKATDRQRETCAAGSWNITHGMTDSPTFSSWRSMKDRCLNKRATGAKNYVGRGIRICDRWLGENGFENFLADMGERPADMTLDRYPDQNGNYEKDNCRWATSEQQNRNRRDNHILHHDGRSMTMTEWAIAVGLKPTTLLKRLEDGWTVEDALTRPHRKRLKREG